MDFKSHPINLLSQLMQKDSINNKAYKQYRTSLQKSMPHNPTGHPQNQLNIFGQAQISAVITRKQVETDSDVIIGKPNGNVFLLSSNTSAKSYFESTQMRRGSGTNFSSTRASQPMTVSKFNSKTE